MKMSFIVSQTNRLLNQSAVTVKTKLQTLCT